MQEKQLKSPNVRCLFDHVITTTNMESVLTAGGIIRTSKEKGTVLSRQTVLVAGPNSPVQVGEEIELFVDRFPKREREPDKYEKNGIGPTRYDIVPPLVNIEGEDYLFLSSREIKFVYVKNVPAEIDTVTSTAIEYTPKYDKPC